jgi:hypothetical protein
LIYLRLKKEWVPKVPILGPGKPRTLSVRTLHKIDLRQRTIEVMKNNATTAPAFPAANPSIFCVLGCETVTAYIRDLESIIFTD